MLTPTHSFFDTIIYFGLNYFDIIKFRYFDLIALYSAGLIDLDHLFSKPVFDPKRNPFKATYNIHFFLMNKRMTRRIHPGLGGFGNQFMPERSIRKYIGSRTQILGPRPKVHRWEYGMQSCDLIVYYPLPYFFLFKLQTTIFL